MFSGRNVGVCAQITALISGRRKYVDPHLFRKYFLVEGVRSSIAVKLDQNIFSHSFSLFKNCLTLHFISNVSNKQSHNYKNGHCAKQKSAKEHIFFDAGLAIFIFYSSPRKNVQKGFFAQETIRGRISYFQNICTCYSTNIRLLNAFRLYKCGAKKANIHCHSPLNFVASGLLQMLVALMTLQQQ